MRSTKKSRARKSMTIRSDANVPQANDAPPLTRVELIWLEGRVERWIRFGRSTGETIIDRRQRILSFCPGSVFAFVHWASNVFGTILSRIDIVRATGSGDAYQTLPCISPGGEFLLRIGGWPKVERVLRAIDAVEALGIESADAACPQSPSRGRAAAAIRPVSASCLASAPQACIMTRLACLSTTLIAALGAATLALFHP
jgi:hypothetical protein